MPATSLSVRGRIGISVDRLLFYATAGVGGGRASFNVADTGKASSTDATATGIVFGPVYGAGVEVAVNDKVSLVADATVTLLRRLLLGERVFEARRRHAYQRLSRRWGSHLAVTLTFIGINLVWLLPHAFLASVPGWGFPAGLAAYLPLIVLALFAGAGAPEMEGP